MLIYIIDETKGLDADSMKNNKNLNELINLRKNYKIPLLILLTHSDDYCDKIEKEGNNWKETCKNTINDNKSNLLKYINDLTKDFPFEENDIMHTVLVEEKEMTEEEKVNNLDENTKKVYDSFDIPEMKKAILNAFYNGKDSNNNEVKEFLDNEIKIIRQKGLIEIIKEKLPYQYHSALIE